MLLRSALSRSAARSFSTANEIVTGFSSYSATTPIESTTLNNGLRVVSVDNNGPCSSVGLFIGAGSQNETDETLGASHALSRLSTSSTFARSQVRLTHDIQNVHSLNVNRGRERTSITAQTHRNNASFLAGLILDMARPRCIEYEITKMSAALKGDTESAMKCPVAGLQDEVHGAAFRSVGLGRSLYAKNFDLNQEQIVRFLYGNWNTSNSVLVAVNVDHSDFVNLLPADAFENHVDAEPIRENADSAYMGGESRSNCAGATHVCIGFQGFSQSSGGLESQRVATALMGRKLGSSWTASSYSYSSAGLVTFQTSATENMVDQFVSLRGTKFTSDDVESAKKALLARDLFDFDADHRCQLAHLTRQGHCHFDDVTADSVNQAVSTILSSNVSLASRGNTARLPPPSAFEAKLR